MKTVFALILSICLCFGLFTVAANADDTGTIPQNSNVVAFCDFENVTGVGSGNFGIKATGDAAHGNAFYIPADELGELIIECAEAAIQKPYEVTIGN